jgi:hypothetical protein
MKIIIAIAVLALVSCNKTKINSPIVGTWSLDSIYVDIGGGGSWQPAQTLVPVIIHFDSNGSFAQKGSQFLGYDHYKIISSDSLQLYNYFTRKSLIIRYSLNDKLTFYYNCIEGCADRFRRQ